VSEDEIEINPRSAAEAGRRLIVLVSLTRRGFLEEELALETLREEVDEERFDILAWLDDNGLGSELSPDGREQLATPIGLISDFDVSEFMIQVDAAVAIAWYLKLIDELPELLADDRQGDLFNIVPSPWDSVGPWLESLENRTLEELAAQRELAEIWNWREWIEERRRSTSGQGLKEIEMAIRETTTEAVNAGLLPNQINGDFPVGGRPFGQLDPEEQDEIGVTAYDRLHAFNWLCGYGSTWSDVPTEI
jgi:Domain of unknown function (DUF4272)